MMEAVVAAIALISAGSGVSQPIQLAPKAACGLVTAAGIPSRRTYSIAGTYFADGVHGSTFDLPGCDVGLSPQLEDAALARVTEFHSTFEQKCGSWLHGDHMHGVFTGHFERRRVRVFGMPAPSTVNFFVITDVETKDEDPTSVACPS